MDLGVQKAGDVVVVLLNGETLEAGNVTDFNDNIEPVLEENAKAGCDMSQVRFIDSVGCRLVLSFLKKVQKQRGSLKICRMTAPVENLFTLMGFDKLFGVVKIRDEAIGAFN